MGVSIRVDQPGRNNMVDIPLWMVSASLSGISMLNSYKRRQISTLVDYIQSGWRETSRTSSMAITTSTVSKLSRPRSFAKCAVDLSCRIG